MYISSDDDIQRLTTNLFKNTTPKGSQTQDPFWDQTAAMLLRPRGWLAAQGVSRNVLFILALRPMLAAAQTVFQRK